MICQLDTANKSMFSESSHLQYFVTSVTSAKKTQFYNARTGVKVSFKKIIMNKDLGSFDHRHETYENQ